MAGQGADSVKSIIYALVANTSIAVAKFFAAFVTSSSAMLAEAIHSVADAGNQVLLLFGMKRSKAPPSDDYPLGFGKTIYFWSFIVALILFSMGGLFSLYEGWHKLHQSQQLTSPWIAIGVLVFAIVAEGISMWRCVKEVNKVRGERSYFQWFRHSRQSELLVIFGEDLAALLGLLLALCAVLATMVTGNPLYDALGSMVIGGLLIIIAIFIGIEVKALLIGQGVEPMERQQMLAFYQQQPEIEKIYNLITLQLGDDVMVAVKAKMVPTGDDRQMIEAINRCEKAFREKFPKVMWSFFEPDLHD